MEFDGTECDFTIRVTREGDECNATIIIPHGDGMEHYFEFRGIREVDKGSRPSSPMAIKIARETCPEK